MVSLGLVCSTSIDTGNTKESFNVKCSVDDSAKLWTKDYQPAYNTNNSECSGYVSVPGFVACNVTAPGDTRRLCNCINNGKCFNCIYEKSLYGLKAWTFA